MPKKTLPPKGVSNLCTTLVNRRKNMYPRKRVLVEPITDSDEYVSCKKRRTRRISSSASEEDKSVTAEPIQKCGDNTKKGSETSNIGDKSPVSVKSVTAAVVNNQLGSTGSILPVQVTSTVTFSRETPKPLLKHMEGAKQAVVCSLVPLTERPPERPAATTNCAHVSLISVGEDPMR